MSPSVIKPTASEKHAILHRLLRDSDPAIRLRAIDMMDRWENRGLECPTCAEAAARTKAREDMLVRTTPQQRERLRVLIAEIDAITKAAQTQSVQPEPESPRLVLREHPQAYKEQNSHEQHEHQEPARPTTNAPEPPAESSRPAVDHQRHAGPQEVELARHLWSEVGLVEVNGVVTHTLGDDHARAILTGAIPLTVARAQHEADLARARKIGGPDSTRRIL